jgi:hypothetical protein
MGRVKRGELERATRLGVQVRAVRDRDIRPGEVGGLLAARPGWLITKQEPRQAQTVLEARDRLRRELADALVTSVHEAWLQEFKHAVSNADIDAINARWAAEVQRARREARQLTAGQVRARTGRERDAPCQAVRYRAGQLLKRALEEDGG